LEALTETDEPQSPEVLQALTSSSDDPEAHLLTQELQDLIQHGIQKLPLDQRVAVVLCDIEGLSYDEVATATQTTLGTVRSRIARGREKLRNYLVQYKELLPRDYRLSTRTSDD
jgi:RNA polymerase sigma-70 factor (ECF subfamily)